MRILEVAGAGIARGFEKLNGAAERLSKPEPDLVSDLVTLKSAELEVRANVTVAKTADEMQKTLVDLIA